MVANRGRTVAGAAAARLIRRRAPLCLLPQQSTRDGLRDVAVARGRPARTSPTDASATAFHRPAVSVSSTTATKLYTAPQRSADTNRRAAIQSSPSRAPFPSAASGPYRPRPTALRAQRCPGCCLARYALTAALRRWSAGTTLPASLAEAFVARRPAFLRASSDTTTFFSFRCATTHLREAIGRADGTAGERVPLPDGTRQGLIASQSPSTAMDCGSPAILLTVARCSSVSMSSV
ncbi:hypothetical protein VIMS_01581 [Mycobacterium marinum]|nr:hypothetical protein VIMS_01581 [Mycobacterium marinum]